MDNKMQYGLVGALLGGTLIWLFISGPSRSNPGTMMENQQVPGMYAEQMGQMDAHFIEQMIPHHEDAITMAELALEQSKRQEILELAQAIIDSQGKEITQMKEWYLEWFDRELPAGREVMMHHGMMGGGLHMGRMGDETDISRLTQAAEFDQAFIEEMIPHHQMAVMMASMLKSGTQRPEMQQLATDIISAQTSEIDQMRQWYSQWF